MKTPNTDSERWNVPPELKHNMRDLARELRKKATSSEDILWQALRNRQLDGRKFGRQVNVGVYILDFYCAEERLAVEVDGPIHLTQQEADKVREEIIESLDIRFLRLTSQQVERHLESALSAIRAAFSLSPTGDEGAGDEGK